MKENDIKLTKPYIIENEKFPKNTVIKIMEKNNYGNMLVKPDGSMLSEDEFDSEADSLIDKIKAQGLIPDSNQIAIMDDLKKYCSIFYARNFKMPEEGELLSYLRNRKQSFSTN